MKYGDQTNEQLLKEMGSIQEELRQRSRIPFGAGWLIDPGVYGCCGRMPCQRTACPIPQPYC